jgi:superfamily I DNA/RNA helicase
MDDIWWVKAEQLDEDQQEVIRLPPEGNFLVVGPPGSGKTNLLLLRARFLALSGHSNVRIVVFTRLLEEFLRTGAGAYNIRPDMISTSTHLGFELLREAGRQIPDTDDFEEQRRFLVTALSELVSTGQLGKVIGTLLLDEAQDYWPAELDLFFAIADNVFVVGDSRQKLYDGADVLDSLKARAQRTCELKYHYRNGTKICRVADEIGRSNPDGRSMLATSNYNEQAYPSSVELFPPQDIEAQCAELLAKLDKQLKAYPSARLGVLCPTREALANVWSRLRDSTLGGSCVLQSAVDGYVAFGDEHRVSVSTIHGAKGLEFRCVHVPMAEHIEKFREKKRNLAYVATTRAKTVLSVYRSSELPVFFDGALRMSEPPPTPPTINELFKG